MVEESKQSKGREDQRWKCDKGRCYFALYQQSSINISIVIQFQTPYSLHWKRRKLGMVNSTRWPLDTAMLLKGDLLQNKNT